MFQKVALQIKTPNQRISGILAKNCKLIINQIISVLATKNNLGVIGIIDLLFFLLELQKLCTRMDLWKRIGCSRLNLFCTDHIFPEHYIKILL